MNLVLFDQGIDHFSITFRSILWLKRTKFISKLSMIHWCLDQSQFEFRLKIKRGLCHDVYACVIQSIWRWISWRDFIKRGNFRQLPTKLDLDVVFHVLVFFEIQSKKSFIKVRIFVGCLPLKTMCRCANIIITLAVIGCVSCCVDGKCDTKQSNCREPCTRRENNKSRIKLYAIASHRNAQSNSST